MGTAVEGCSYLVCLHVDKTCLGGCGTAVHTQNIFPAGNCLSMFCREVCDFGKLCLKAVQTGKTYLVLGYKLVRSRHWASVLGCKVCSSQGLEIRSLLWDYELDIGCFLFDEPYDMAVSGDASHQDDFSFADSGFLEEVDNLYSHDVAEGEDNVLFCSLTFIKTMCTVALHKDGTSGGKLKDTGCVWNAVHILKLHVHSGQLLLKELSCSGGTLAAREVVYNPTLIAKGVYNQVLAAQGNNSIGLKLKFLECLFDT